jgi:hypothetical protein
MEEKIEQIRLPDGRYGQKRIIDDYDCESGFGEKVVEKYEEPERQVNLRERITEKRRPCVYERKVETIQDNEIVDVKVESLDPMAKMELREHIALASSVKNQSENDCDCYVTKEELKEAMVAAAEEIRDASTVNMVQTKNALKPKVRLQNIVEEEAEEEEQWSWVEWSLLAIVGVQAAWLIVNVLPRYLGV